MTQPPAPDDSPDTGGPDALVDNRKLLAIMDLMGVDTQCDADLKGWDAPGGGDLSSLPEVLTGAWSSPVANEQGEDLTTTVGAISTCMDGIVTPVQDEFIHQRDEVGVKVPADSEEAMWGTDAWLAQRIAGNLYLEGIQS